MMEKLRFYCFGEFEVFRNGEALNVTTLGGVKARRLLKILLTHQGSFLTVDQLIEWLWNDDRPEHPERTLRNYVYQLRKVLEADVADGQEYKLIRTGEEGCYGLFSSKDYWMDVQAFEAIIKEAESLVARQSWQEAVQQLQEAAALYRGDFLKEELYEEWTKARRNELQQRYGHILVLLAEGHAQSQDWTNAIACAQKTAALAPGHEGVHRHLMRYLCHAGNRDGAIKVFKQLEAYLKEEIQVAPEQQTLELHQQVLNGEIPELPQVERSKPASRSRPPSAPTLAARAVGSRPFPWKRTLAGAIGITTLALLWNLMNAPRPSSLPSPSPSTAIQFFQNDAGAFKAVGGFPPVMVDFDELEPGTDLTGKSLDGVRFERSRPSSAPLVVVRGWETFTPGGYRCEPLGDAATHRLFPTTGGNVLSPGGLELTPGRNDALEDDDLVLLFDDPVSAVGFDLLWQSADGSRRKLTLQDALGKTLFEQEVAFDLGTPGVAPPAGSSFVGFVSESNNIARVVVDEFDSDNCRENANGGYDTIYFKRLAEKAQPVPENAFVRQWGSTGVNPGEFSADSGPRGIAVVEENGVTSVYQSDYINNRVQKFDAQGRFVAQFPMPSALQDIEYDGHGNFYARAVGPDSPAGHLLKLDFQMNVLWTSEAPAAEWVSYGLCIDSGGSIHVPVALSTVPGDHKIYKYDPNGNLLAEYGAGLVKGSGDCEADKEGRIYAIDGTWSNLRVFNNAGQLQDTVRFGYGISGIAMDPQSGDFFLITRFEGKDIKVRKFDPSFNLLAEWGGEGQGSGRFLPPIRDLEVDGQGFVYVADAGNHLIQVFQPK